MVDLSRDQIHAAKSMWTRGYSLGTIAAHVGCSIYALSPWLYMDEVDIAQATATNQKEPRP